MKRIYLYIFCGIIVLLILVLIFQFRNKQSKIEEDVSSDGKSLSQKLSEQTIRAPIAEKKKNSWVEIDKFAIEMSREICKQENAALSILVDPSLDNLKPGDIVPLDSDKELSAQQAEEWLKKTANSKCSSFRRESAEKFFSKSVVDEQNYKEVFFEWERVMGQNPGLTPFRLLRQAIRALDKAANEEAISLRKAIIYSLNTQIKDSSSYGDIAFSVQSLEYAKENGLISYSNEQIDKIKREMEEDAKKYVQEAQELNRRYFSADEDFLNLNTERMINVLGFEGVKLNMANEQKGYESVRRFAERLSELLDEALRQKSP